MLTRLSISQLRKVELRVYYVVYRDNYSFVRSMMYDCMIVYICTAVVYYNKMLMAQSLAEQFH